MLNRSLRSIFLCVAIACSIPLHAQQNYWVYFTDKAQTPFAIDRPQEYLSPEAISRRTRHAISIREADLPVDPAYVAAVRQTGVTVRVVSKWLNAVSVQVQDPAQLAVLSSLPCVHHMAPVQRYGKAQPLTPDNTQPYYRSASSNDLGNTSYGASDNQVKMIGVDFLHSMGYRGQGITIAVLDGGFYGVDVGAGFSSLHAKDQIKGVYNVPDANEEVFVSTTHGSNVLSIMAVDMPGTYIGSAPDADYWLIRTEVTESEFVIEEDYWLAGAEFADSIGADIINSSLGYTTFDDSLQDHTYADMDGNTTVVTKAADMAAAAGILVVNSAGNEGDSDWHFIGAPADGDSVFTIGAVDGNGVIAAFSSVGPTFDGRLKPNVVTQGDDAAVVSMDGWVGYGSGTSYASPLMAGACASLMSAYPELSNMEVIELVQATADRAAFPNNQYGYGIPNLAKAFIEKSGVNISADQLVTVLPNPAETEITVFITGAEDAQAVVYLCDVTGNKLAMEEVRLRTDAVSAVKFIGLEQLAAGVYFVRLAGDAYSETHEIFVR